MVATVLGVAMAVFLVLTVLPGDAARLIVGAEAQPERYFFVRQALRLDEPWPVRFWHWLSQALHGDLGKSLRYQDRSVSEILRRGLAITFPLASGVAILAFLLGTILGTTAARDVGGPVDLLISTVSQAFLAVPEFWLGIALILLFSVALGLLPAGGFPGWNEAQALHHLLLPALALLLPRVAYFSRLSRAVMVEALFSEAVRTARAKGLSERRVVFVHALRQAILPLLAGLSLTLGRLFAGALVVEQVFALPGLGRYAVEAAFGRDVPLLLGIAVSVTAVVVATNFFADLAYGLLDPRIRSV